MKRSLIVGALVTGLAAVAVPSAAAASTLSVCAAGCTHSTLQAAVDAAQAGDTVELRSDLTVAGTTVVDEDVTITGPAGTVLTQMADAVTFLVTADGATIGDLTITSDRPYPKEFIQVGADDVTITRTTVRGPEQRLPMSGWVTNRALVTQGGISGLAVEDNTFHSLRSGAYLNPDGTGSIERNTAYNTKGDFLIDNAAFAFRDNRRGPATSPSEWGFVVFASTATDRYPSMVALSAANNGMSAWDQRSGEKVVAPQSAEDCRNRGWATFTPAFTNQGQCVKAVTVPAPR